MILRNLCGSNPTQPLPLDSKSEPVKMLEVMHTNQLGVDLLPQAQGYINDPVHSVPMNIQTRTIPAMIHCPGVPDGNSTQTNSLALSKSFPQNHTFDKKFPFQLNLNFVMIT